MRVVTLYVFTNEYSCVILNFLLIFWPFNLFIWVIRVIILIYIVVFVRFIGRGPYVGRVYYKAVQVFAQQ